MRDERSACALAKCVDKITGVATAKTASSLTDIWFVTFKNGVIYDGQPATRAVLKIWINDWRYTSGLEYERRIYAEVIEAMLTARMSPCFVRCYASSSGCSQNSLLEILTAGMKNVTPDKIRYAWMRNLTALKSALPRPAIDDVSAKIKREGRLKEVPPSTTDTCGMIMTESMQGERTFHQFLNAGVIAPGGNSTFTDAMWRVLIQIATACYAMSYTKLTHYDLHANNIFVKNVPSSERRTVVQYAGELMLTYNNLDLVPKVYDFDNSYAHSLGTNIALTDRFGVCKWYGRCNLNIDNIDIMKVLCGVYKACDGLPVLQDIIADACCISSDSKSLMKDLFKTQYCWFVKGSGFNIEAYPESTWSKFRSSRDILYALARAAPASALNVKFDAVGQAPAAGADVYSVPPVRGMVRRAQSPVRRAPSPVRRAPSPVRRAPSPVRRAPSPVRRVSSPVRRVPSPVRRAPSPVRRAPSPVRRVPSPVRRAPSPVRRAPSPVRRAPSPVRRAPNFRELKAALRAPSPPPTRLVHRYHGRDVQAMQAPDDRVRVEMLLRGYSTKRLNELKEALMRVRELVCGSTQPLRHAMRVSDLRNTIREVLALFKSTSLDAARTQVRAAICEL